MARLTLYFKDKKEHDNYCLKRAEEIKKIKQQEKQERINLFNHDDLKPIKENK